ncbi:glycosyltransferase [Svornostia abyssi]|uniref:Glycosyltransferase n=1 Tax=Svornostia abyssi TaxID=2898438 RepID=A0ABY5PHG1_9ACTN|nr:glycosyltransferase [Parviterribacteraceae bacterium J379]
MRCGPSATGRSISAGPAGSSGTSSSGRACGSRSGPTASAACTKGACTTRGSRGPSPCSKASTRGRLEPAKVRDADPLVVFAGRHIAEKRVPALVPALVAARERVPGLRGVIFGDGPERDQVLELIARHDAGDWLRAPGFVDGAEVEDAMHRALCMVLPSRREGYGQVVIEASAAATPSVVVQGPDNAATEHVTDGVNGVIAPSADPADLAGAIVRVADAGTPLRASTAGWFADNAERLSLGSSLRTLLTGYADSTRR